MSTDGCHRQASPASEPSLKPTSPQDPAANDALDWRLLGLAVLLPLLATILLFRLDVPLGKPARFVYLYSPVAQQRLATLPGLIRLAALLAAGTALIFSARRAVRAAAFIIITLGVVGAASWTYLAPPEFRSQHVFNMQSPSHDGAFLTEANYVLNTGVRKYLRAFPTRAQSLPKAMRGTRVISNPPGTTLAAAATVALLERSPALTRWVASWGLGGEIDPVAEELIITSLGFSLALWLFWLLAAPLLYLLGKLFLPSAAAAVFALTCLLSPATLLFTPGKDPAQLLTTALALWLWLLAWRRQRLWAAGCAGGVLVLACLVSLVHIWIAAVVCTATVLATPKADRRRFLLRTTLPALAGAVVLIGALAWLADLNFFAAIWSVARSQAEVTRGESAMPIVWQALGVPLFLLFAGPALWSVGFWLLRRRLHDTDARFGLYLLLGSVLIMLVTIGFTNVETPRLWIPFTPLLLLGAALQLPTFRNPQKRTAALLATLVFVQIGVSAVQWSLMDMREAEMRLLQREDGGARFFH